MWTPLYPQAKFIRPILANLKLLIKTNEAEALQWANDGTAMPPFLEYRKALWYNTHWPIISIVGETTQKTGPGDEVLPQTHSVLIEIEDAGPNPDDLFDTVTRRVQAIDMIITSANINLLKVGMDQERIAINDLWVTEHKYAQFARGNPPSIYLQAGDLIVNIETIEG